jgi:membrane fusion protein (multidrug efflux system)
MPLPTPLTEGTPLMTGSARFVAMFLLASSALLPGPDSASAQTAPKPAVIIERIKVEDVSNPAQYTARIEAINAVDIRARVQGFLNSVAFRAGQTVKAGDTLFVIEPDQFEANAASAQAQVARAEATRKSTERTLSRNQQLFDRKTVSQATLDDAQAAFDIAAADVKVAEAALRTAELNLSYTHIKAPIAGEIGRSALTAGNLAGPDSGSLARIVELDPIRVAFSMTEGQLVTLRQQSQGVALDPGAVNIALKLANGTDYADAGRIEYVENEVDPRTGTATVRAVFRNPDHVLIPGQFVTLYTRDKEVQRLPIIPQSAVLQDREGRFVYLLGENDTVSQRRIKTGARVANGWAVTEGLSGNELVVVQGIQRLQDGMTVQPSEGQPAVSGQ